MAAKAKNSEGTEPAEIPPVVQKRTEEKQVQERVALGAHVVYETIRREGEEELKRSSSALALVRLGSRIVDGLFSGGRRASSCPPTQ